MKYPSMKYCFFIALTSLTCAAILPAAACGAPANHETDRCLSLDTNPQWETLFTEFSENYAKDDYQNALKITRQLEEICNRSPILNLSIANTYRKLANIPKAFQYANAAAKNTNDFNVSPEIEIKIFRLQSELATQIINEKEKTPCNQEIQKTNPLPTASDPSAADRNDADRQLLQNQQNGWKTVMWTGIGFGIAGVALATTGAVLATNASQIQTSGSCADNTTLQNCDISSLKDENAVKRNLGWTLLGSGIAAAIVGATMAGIGGYHVAHPPKYDFSFAVGIQDIQFSWIF